MSWDESKHPRVPAGSSEGGQFTAVRAARKAAGLAYGIEASDGPTTVHKVPGGSLVDQALLDEFARQEEAFTVRVIFNTETRTWHIAENVEGSEGGTDHGDFVLEAMEGITEPDYTEQIQTRGFISFHGSDPQLDMYDFTDQAEFIADRNDPLGEKKMLAKLKQAQKVTEGYTLYYKTENGRTKKMPIDWFYMDEGW